MLSVPVIFVKFLENISVANKILRNQRSLTNTMNGLCTILKAKTERYAPFGFNRLCLSTQVLLLQIYYNHLLVCVADRKAQEHIHKKCF